MKLYEAGDTVAANVRDWAHVRLFSPWSLNADHAAKAILKRHGWQEPHGDGCRPAMICMTPICVRSRDTPELRAVIETRATVKAISRQGIGKVVTRGREDRPFSLLVQNGAASASIMLAPIIDASGTWQQPNPLGCLRLRRPLAKRLRPTSSPMAFPMFSGAASRAYAGKRVLVIGGGHSAANVLLDLARLAETR